MIETEQSVCVNAPIDRVWTYVRDIRNWADLMPGLQECDIVDDNDSRWKLKVGAGGLVRVVNVLVHVDEWAGPERARFTFKLGADPVHGGGAYVAKALNAQQTEIALQVRVEGTGPMAQMWEAMGKPLLPQFAKGFAEQLKVKIEGAVGAPAAPRVSVFGKIAAWLRKICSEALGSKARVE